MTTTTATTTILAVAAVLAAAGCGSSNATPGDGGGGDAGSADAPPGPRPNNSAMLSGPAVGSGALPLSDVRHVVPATVVSGGTGFQVGASATISRLSTIVDSGAYLALPITNTTAGLRCYVAAHDLVWLDGAGTVLRDAVTYVQGSVGSPVPQIAPPSAGAVCLVPGESGYLLDVVASPGIYGPVARVTVALTAQDAGYELLPGAIVLPTGYRITTPDTLATLAIDFRNTGSAAVSVGMGFHRYVLLDDAGNPVHWSFADDATTPPTDLLPGQSGTATYNLPNIYDGQAMRMKAYVDFDPPTGTTTTTTTTTTTAPLTLVREARDVRARQAAAAAAMAAASAVHTVTTKAP